MKYEKMYAELKSFILAEKEYYTGDVEVYGNKYGAREKLRLLNNIINKIKAIEENQEPTEAILGKYWG